MIRRSSLAGRLAIALGFAVALCGVQRVEGAGSPDTRLIGLGFNFLSLAPFTPGQMFEIDKQTGGVTPLGPWFVVEGQRLGPNLAANSADEIFNVLGAATDARVSQLTLTGEVLDFVLLEPFPVEVQAIAFDSQDRLLAITLPPLGPLPVPPLLSQIDTMTGVATPITALETVVGRFTSMAFDLDDNLYAVADNLGLTRIDATTGQVTVIGGDLANPPLFGPERRPLVFDRDGTLFAATDRLVVVDPATGETTPVGGIETFDFNTMVGLAVVTIPEPGSPGLVSLAGIALAPVVRRARSGRRAKCLLGRGL